jgi:hypothetical protein
MSGIVIDSSTQFIIEITVAVMSVIIATIVAFLIFVKSRPRKLVTFRIVTQESLLSVSNELKDKLKIFYDSKEIANVNLFKIEITNSGNKEISEKNYIEPITIFFGNQSQILLADITEYKPTRFPISLSNDGKTIKFSKTLFNSGESFTVKTLVSNPEFYGVYGRIAGGKIQQTISKTESPNFPLYIIVSALLIGLIGVLLSGFMQNYALGGFFLIVLFAPIICLFLIAASQIFFYAQSKLSKR